ncbi:hypothetical protein ElyMa_002144000 [Elysia marginata]|uniref:Uncharacterized protein n=1 Tax=Elysia marginata TaxID=1093978 RepID=A0AAV4FK74_9GAST|nr:hypothetical protein ElyMa_002144000 [Elysia marginata]
MMAYCWNRISRDTPYSDQARLGTSSSHALSTPFCSHNTLHQTPVSLGLDGLSLSRETPLSNQARLGTSSSHALSTHFCSHLEAIYTYGGTHSFLVCQWYTDGPFNVNGLRWRTIDAPTANQNIQPA